MEDHIVAGHQEQVDEFIFPLNEISKPIFDQILKWMENHENQSEPKLNEDSLTNERVWFTLTDWERKFFDVDFEVLKDYMMAANFLDLRSLYFYAIQEGTRCIMDREPMEVREMLGLDTE
uniref:Skp1_POZ domain-containing protein n=1 Tax=Globodera pallida TaxID=36090 RepID=A0A183C4Z4_GLOPA